MNSFQYRKLTMKRALAGGLVLFMALTSAIAEGSEHRDVLIADAECVITVPAAWQAGSLGAESSMQLHLQVYPVHRTCGHFTVHVLDRGSTTREAWIEYHKTRNLPGAHGHFRIAALEDRSAGCYPAKLFHVVEMESRKEHGLLEALVFTGSHVVFLSYLYDLTCGTEAQAEMEAILDSFNDAPEAVERARLRYEEGRTLADEQFGLFLELPEGWMPLDDDRSGGMEVRLPSGGRLQVLIASRVCSGLEGLKKEIDRHVPGLTDLGSFDAAAFGTAAAKAFRCGKASSGNESAVECIFGLHGKGGYAMILHSDDEGERDLLKKMSARALLVDRKEADALRRDALAAFRKSLLEKDEDQVREALSTLVLFPCSRSAVETVARGLKSSEAIQIACAEALGRMGSTSASAALEKTLVDSRTGDAVKLRCIQGLRMIGSPRERKVLERLGRKDRRCLSSRVRISIQDSLADFPTH